MFWTAFVWGLGASCGASSFGLLMFFVLKTGGLDWLMNTKRYKAIESHSERMLDALHDRNELSADLVRSALRIADAIEAFEIKSR